MVSHEHRFIWVAVAKVASMVMQTAVCERLAVPFAEWTRHALGSIAEVARLRDYFRFAFVRNPWARLCSCYLDKIVGPTLRRQEFILADYGMKPGMSFDAFVRRVAQIPDANADEHFVSQVFALSHEGRLAVDYVGRFENLPDDWDVLRGRLGLPELSWRPVGTSRPRFDFTYHHSYYTPALIEIVRQRYTADVQWFGYEPPSVK
jgi:chondroitin 4-sulfotransferase 11